MHVIGVVAERCSLGGGIEPQGSTRDDHSRTVVAYGVRSSSVHPHVQPLTVQLQPPTNLRTPIVASPVSHTTGVGRLCRAVHREALPSWRRVKPFLGLAGTIRNVPRPVTRRQEGIVRETGHAVSYYLWGWAGARVHPRCENPQQHSPRRFAVTRHPRARHRASQPSGQVGERIHGCVVHLMS